MIKTAAACLGGSGAALIPIHTSSLFRNSCSSRPPSKPSFPTFSVLWSVFPRFKVWPKRRWKKFTFTGRDLAIIPEPVRCMRRQASLSANMAENFLKPGRKSSNSKASAAIPLPAFWPWLSISLKPSLTATSFASSAGFIT